MESKYKLKLKEVQVCPECKSKRNFKDGNLIQCSDCGHRDSDEEFYDVEIIPTKEEICPECGKAGEIELLTLCDEYGLMKIKCKCGYTGGLDEFLGLETFEEFALRMQKIAEENGNA